MRLFGKDDLSLTEAVLAALVYSDLFSYPLTSDEVWFWLPRQATKEEVSRQLTELVSAQKISYLSPFYFLSREKIVASRRRREAISAQKMILAQKFSRLISRCPGVGLVALSGNLAMRAADRNDDIDFLIIALSGYLYRARLTSIMVTELAGWRRHYDQESAPNKACLNVFLEANHLTIPSSRRDFYTAHEALQLIPLAGQKGLFNQFLTSNSWLASFFPQAYRSRFSTGSGIKSWKSNSVLTKESFWEKLARRSQLHYMKLAGHQPVISGRQLFFHPHDRRFQVLNQLKKNYSKISSQ